MSSRTLKVQNPSMDGKDADLWRGTLRDIGREWGAVPPIDATGPYTTSVRAITASVLYGLGIAQDELKHGLTPALRTKVRNKRLTARERARYVARAGWRKRLVKRWAPDKVAPPLARVLADSWGYHPGVHDGLDLICAADAPIYAMIKSRVVRADTGGWWGLGARPSWGHPVSDGDGIIVLEVLENIGPFKVGQRIGYGHAEHPIVKVGQIVEAGQQIGRAGFANAWHVHLVINDGDQGTRGVGRRDPRPHYEYATKHGSLR